MQIQLNLEKLKQTKVHFCIPCYGGQISEQTFMGIIKWANQAKDLGIDWTVDTLVNESLISRGRNTLTARFLNNKDTTHLFFIDADIGFDAWHILTILNHDKDVVCGLYPMKSLPLKWVVNGINNEDGTEQKPRDDYLIEVSKSGTGFMCIKQHVFEALKAHPAVKPFNNDIGLPKDLDQYMYTYFDSAVRENRYYSEDWTFCENWRDLGGKVWVDSRILLKHTGYFNFCNENDQSIREAYKTVPSMINEEPDRGVTHDQAIKDIADENKEIIISDTPLPGADSKPKTLASKKKSSKRKKR